MPAIEMNIPKTYLTADFYKDVCVQNAEHDSGMSLKFVPFEHRAPSLYHDVCELDGCALEHVPDKLRTPDLCLTACKQDAMALWHVLDKLRTPDLCLAACKQLWHECGATEDNLPGGWSLLGEGLRYIFNHLVPVESRVALLDLIPGDRKQQTSTILAAMPTAMPGAVSDINDIRWLPSPDNARGPAGARGNAHGVDTTGL